MYLIAFFNKDQMAFPATVELPNWQAAACLFECLFRNRIHYVVKKDGEVIDTFFDKTTEKHFRPFVEDGVGV